jgi:hypothetical protein
MSRVQKSEPDARNTYAAAAAEAWILKIDRDKQKIEPMDDASVEREHEVVVWDSE